MIGAGGDRDRGKRPVMGAAAAQGADLVLVTDDNPRTEDPAAIRAEVLAGATGPARPPRIIEVAGRRAAIDEAVRLAAPGRRGRACSARATSAARRWPARCCPFDDRIELADALRARFGDLAGQR